MADGKSYRVTGLDKGKGAYALVDLEFLCGCELSCQNVRTNALQLRKQYGLEPVIGGMNSWPERRKLVSVKRNSLHQVLSKGNK